MLTNKVFLDSAYAIALSAVTDQYHQKAEMLAKQIETSGNALITTRAVVLEIGNTLARLRYRNAAIELSDSLEEDPNVEIIPLFSKGRLYERNGGGDLLQGDRLL